MTQEEFRTENINEKIRIQKDEDTLAFFKLIGEVETIRKKHGAYVWVFPIKWRDESGATQKQTFGWEIEYENGYCKSYGYSGEEELPTYESAITAAINFFNANPTI